jgi:hypothetical protein
VLGLSHVDSAKQVMFFQTIRRTAEWGAGDLRGLRKVGAGRGCITRPESRPRSRTASDSRGTTTHVTHR